MLGLPGGPFLDMEKKMKSLLQREAWKIEGDIFKLYRKTDKCLDLNEFIRLKKEIWELSVKHEEYLKMINDLPEEKRKV